MATFILLSGLVSVWWMRYYTVGYRQKQVAQIFANIISQQIDDKITGLKIHVSSPWWIEAVKEVNSRYVGQDGKVVQEKLAGMDKDWDAPGSRLLIEVLSLPLSKRLKVMVDTDEEIAEIFVSDIHGGLAGVSGKTTDYFQADEAWWQNSYNNGKGDVYFDGVSLDESAGKISMAFAIPLKDADGQVIGIAKAIVDDSKFFQQLMSYRFGRTGHLALIDIRGTTIYQSGLKPMAASNFPPADLERLMKNRDGFMILKDHHLNARAIIAAGKVNNRYLEARGLNWVLFVTQEEKEIFAPLYYIFFLTGIFALLISSLISFFMRRIISNIFIQPLQKMHLGIWNFSHGLLDYKINLDTGDEIQELADSFNEMTEQLHKTTVSKEYLDNIILNMTDSMIVTDAESRIITVNKAACAFFGYTETELFGKAIDFLFSDIKDKNGLALGAVKPKEMRADSKISNQEIKYTAADGRVISAVLNASVFRKNSSAQEQPVNFSAGDAQEALGVIYVINDISERKKLEEEAQRRLHELEVFYKVGYGREARIIELKKEIEELRRSLGTE